MLAGLKKWRLLDMVKKHDPDAGAIEVFFTRNKADAQLLANKALDEGFTHVVAVGGDGTISDVAKALINSSCTLGVIPVGSGNGFARSLMIPSDPKKALDLFFKGEAKTIDTLLVNGKTCLGVTGIGFDAKVSKNFAEKTTRGLLTYLSVILSTYPHYNAKNYEMIVDGKKRQEKAFLLCFANTDQYGNNAMIAPEAKIDDGFLDIAVIKEFPAAYSPKLAFDLVQGRLKNSTYFSTIKAKDVVIKNSSTLIHIDGEPERIEGDIHITIAPKSLHIIAGEKASRFKLPSGLKKLADQSLGSTFLGSSSSLFSL
jgi:diacylglycerol kinase (ATP)